MPELSNLAHWRGLLVALSYCLASGQADGTTIVNRPMSLAEQVKRADYVVHAVIVTTELVETQLPGDRRKCGTSYGARIIQQFRGTLPAVVKFTAYPMPRTTNLAAGDEVLLLLRDSKNHPDAGTLADSAVSPSTECRKRLPTIYTPAGLESVFGINQFEPASGERWLFFGELTTMPDVGIDTVSKRCLGACDNCEMSEPARVKWNSLRTWIAKWSALH